MKNSTRAILFGIGGYGINLLTSALIKWDEQENSSLSANAVTVSGITGVAFCVTSLYFLTKHTINFCKKFKNPSPASKQLKADIAAKPSAQSSAQTQQASYAYNMSQTFKKSGEQREECIESDTRFSARA